jgi:outer membrane lipoprotein-sorting protein
MSKNLKNGNNMTNQEIVNYILNISSYEANITVEVTSNKNFNKYVINQKYISQDTSSQEVLEPSNIAGVKIIRENNELRIENTQLSLTKIFENYSYMADSCLDLSTFIDDYKNNGDRSMLNEIDGQIVMETQSLNDNKYTMHKTLYVEKDGLKPIKMEIKDNNNNTTVNILYNEVKIN